jgi:hypothetical protein
MKTLLVYPEFPDTYWSFRHALSFEGKRSAFPPLGLLTISAMLPDRWERRLVDMNIQPLKPSDIKWADVIFASAMLVQKDSLRRVVELCKAEARGRSPFPWRGRNDTAGVRARCRTRRRQTYLPGGRATSALRHADS